MQRLISPIKIFGGGFFKCKKIIDLIKWDQPIYCESFCGGFNVGLNSPNFTIDGLPIRKFAFDKNTDLIQTWRTIQTDPIKLQNILRNTTYDIKNFELAKKSIKDLQDGLLDPYLQFYFAYSYLVRNRMSRGADNKTFGWSDRLRRGKPEYISAWETFIDNIPIVSKAVKNVTFMDGDAIELIKEFGLDRRDDVIYYMDPPFVHESRVSRKAYDFEMATKSTGTNQLTHEDLIHYVLQNRGTYYLSGYKNSLYDELIGSKILAEWQVKNFASQQKIKPVKTECLWLIK